MTKFNPYEPSGTVSAPQFDGTNANKRVGSFIIIQCLSFVASFWVISIAISGYEAGIDAVLISALRIFRLAGMAMLLWLPHAFMALMVSQVRRTAARLSGVEAATSLLFGTYVMEWILRDWVTSSLSGWVFLALGLLISLASVALIGHLSGKERGKKEYLPKV